MLQPLLPYLLLSAAAVGTLAQDTHLVSERWVNAPAEARTPGSGSLLAKRHIDENNHYVRWSIHVFSCIESWEEDDPASLSPEPLASHCRAPN